MNLPRVKALTLLEAVPFALSTPTPQPTWEGIPFLHRWAEKETTVSPLIMSIGRLWSGQTFPCSRMNKDEKKIKEFGGKILQNEVKARAEKTQKQCLLLGNHLQQDRERNLGKNAWNPQHTTKRPGHPGTGTETFKEERVDRRATERTFLKGDGLHKRRFLETKS